jgi:hypothetical protein
MRRLNDKKSVLPEHPELEEHSLISEAFEHDILL